MEQKRLAYNIAALSGKAFAGKLEAFDREFPERPTAAQVSTDAKRASDLIKNMKIKPTEKNGR